MTLKLSESSGICLQFVHYDLEPEKKEEEKTHLMVVVVVIFDTN